MGLNILASAKIENRKRRNIDMSNNNLIDNNRRSFMTLSAIGLIVVPLGSFLVSQNAEARGSSGVNGTSKEIAKLPENDEQAMALGYRADAKLVDITKFKRGEDQYCHNCQLYSGSLNKEWGPCAIFSYRIDPILHKNYVVSAKGWCKSWGPRASD
ncbi:MAG: high-potential iron-sulfur protein [Methylobacter sp.]